MKKIITYNLEGLLVNKGMIYQTSKKLTFGSKIFLDGLYWRVTGIAQ